VESIATFLDLRKDPNTGANAINVMTNSEADAKKIEEKLAKVPEVLRTNVAGQFLCPKISRQNCGSSARAPKLSIRAQP